MTPSIKSPFIHEFVPATRPDLGITLLLLHGTGGSEQDLLPLGRELLPGAALLSPRGRVLENGMPRFFRRFAEGVFDVEDLKFQTHELNDFLKAAAQRYGVEENKTVAVGYSNGANIAASLLLLHPDTLAGAVLFRAMVPFEPDFEPNLAHASVLLSGGMRDTIVPRDNTEALAALLASFGAQIEAFWHRGGHELGQDDLIAAQQWLSRKMILWRS
ncbi:MAG TPA: alpha/beta hydrolase [Bacillota bacterium]|nr:alpha/beta hydrolase [Bacillota bacterium]